MIVITFKSDERNIWKRKSRLHTWLRVFSLFHISEALNSLINCCQPVVLDLRTVVRLGVKGRGQNLPLRSLASAPYFVYFLLVEPQRDLSHPQFDVSALGSPVLACTWPCCWVASIQCPSVIDQQQKLEQDFWTLHRWHRGFLPWGSVPWSVGYSAAFLCYRCEYQSSPRPVWQPKMSPGSARCPCGVEKG